MNDLTHLKNFPFSNMEEFSFAFNSGKAEPVVPKEFAKDWALKSPLSRIRKTVTISYGMPIFLLVGIIIISNYSYSIKWYHALGVAFFSVFVFSNSGRTTLGGFRKVLSYVFIGFILYFFIIGSNDFGILFLLGFGMLFFWELTYFMALKEIVSVLLVDVTLLEELWNKKIVLIRFTDGYVVGLEKTFKVTS